MQTFDRFSVAISRDGAIAFVDVSGELDVATAPGVRDALAEIVVDQRNETVRVDLARVTSIDSSGFAVLLMALSGVRKRGGQMTLVNAAPRIMRLFEVTGLMRSVDITPADHPAGPVDPGHRSPVTQLVGS